MEGRVALQRPGVRLAAGPILIDMARPRDPQKKMLVKLAVARTDILAACQVCDLLIQHKPDPHESLYAALNSALVVAYGRPFTTNKPLGALPAKWGRFANARHQELHEDLLRHRHQWIAHSDVGDRKVMIVPAGSRLAPGEHPLHAAIAVETAMFADDVIPEIRNLCSDLYQRLHNETEKLVDAIYPPGFYAPSPIEIRLADL